MPGSVGGGHGGGFGGGRSFGGGHGGGFGGGRTGFSGGANKSGANVGIPFILSAGSRGGRRGGCLTGLIGILALPLVIIAVSVGTVVSSVSGGSRVETVTSIERVAEKLEAEYCTPLTDCCESELPEVLDAEGEERINSAILTFYDETGVQPYFYLTGSIDGNASPGEARIASFMLQKYTDLFGKDEGHLLVMMLFRDYEDYERYYIAGNDIQNVVSQTDCEDLLEEIDDCAAQTDDVAEAVSNAFVQSAQRTMYVTLVRADDSAAGESDMRRAVKTVFALLFVCGFVFVVIRLVVRKKEPAVNPAGPAQYREVGPSPSVTGSYPAGGEKKKYQYPVRCPNCGATDYPRDDGTCQYCNGKIGP